MPIETSYSNLRENLASLLDRVTQDQDVVIVHRRGSADVAMIPAEELTGLLETAHLLRSPKNARRLLDALATPKRAKASTPAALRKQLKLQP